MDHETNTLGQAGDQQPDSSISTLSSPPSSLHATSASSLPNLVPPADTKDAFIHSNLSQVASAAELCESGSASPLLQHSTLSTTVSSISILSPNATQFSPSTLTQASGWPDTTSQPTLWQRIKHGRERKSAIHLRDDRRKSSGVDSMPQSHENVKGPQSNWWKRLSNGKETIERNIESIPVAGPDETLAIDTQGVEGMEESNSALKRLESKEVENLHEDVRSDPYTADPGEVATASTNGAGKSQQNLESLVDEVYKANDKAIGITAIVQTPSASLSGQTPAPIPSICTAQAQVDQSNAREVSCLISKESAQQLDTEEESDQFISRFIGQEPEVPSAVQSQEDLASPDIHCGSASSVAATFNDDEELIFTKTIDEPLTKDPEPNTVLITPSDQGWEWQCGGSSAIHFRTTARSVDTNQIRPVQGIRHDSSVIVPNRGSDIYTNGAVEAQDDDHKGEQILNTRLRIKESFGTGLTRAEALGCTMLNAEALGRIPSQFSDVVTLYRTNEWAKHISTAEVPVFDEPDILSEGEEAEASAQFVEASTTLAIRSLERIASRVSLMAATAPGGRDQMNSTAGPVNADKIADGKTNPPGPYLTFEQSLSGYNRDATSRRRSTLQHIDCNTPEVLLKSTSSSSLSSPPSKRAFRTTSTPLITRNLRSLPIDEDAEAEFMPSIQPPASLMSATAPTTVYYTNNNSRQFIMPSSSSLNLIDDGDARSDIYTNCLTNFGGSDSRVSLDRNDDDNVSLRELKARIRSRRASSNSDCSSIRQGSTGFSYDQREATFASWRDSVQQEAAFSSMSHNNMEQRRMDMMLEKQQTRMSKHQQELARVYMNNSFDQAMRRRDMQMLHREAIRKMQAQANRHLRKVSA